MNEIRYSGMTTLIDIQILKESTIESIKAMSKLNYFYLAPFGRVIKP